MNNVISELILTDYYFADAVFGRHLDGAAFIAAQCKSYYIPEKEAEELYKTAKSVTGIDTVDDYYRYLRILQFISITGGNKNKVPDELITLKGKVMELARQYKIITYEFETEANVHNKVNAPCNANLIPLMRVKGIMLCEGIFFKKDAAQGIGLLSKAARWNDIPSLMPLVRYDEENRLDNVNLLYTLADGTIYGDLLKQTRERYRIKSNCVIEESRILDKVFQTGNLFCDFYDSQYAGVLYGKTLGRQDKEKLLLNKDSGIKARLNNLPVMLSADYPIEYDAAAFGCMAIIRSNEITAITNMLDNADLRTDDNYRPPCLYSESRYMLASYINAFRQLFVGASVQYISAANLCLEDVLNTDGNVFVRSCNDKNANVYLIDMSGKADAVVAGKIVDFLSAAKRREFYIKEMDVTLDLSPVFPVCFCDKANYRLLKEQCEVIEIGKPDKDEQALAVLNLIDCKTDAYGLESLCFDEQAYSRFASMDIDAVEKVMDKAVIKYRKKGKPLVITDEMMTDLWKYAQSDVFGFGRKTV